MYVYIFIDKMRERTSERVRNREMEDNGKLFHFKFSTNLHSADQLNVFFVPTYSFVSTKYN